MGFEESRNINYSSKQHEKNNFWFGLNALSVTVLKSCYLHVCFALYTIFVVIVLVDCFSSRHSPVSGAPPVSSGCVLAPSGYAGASSSAGAAGRSWGRSCSSWAESSAAGSPGPGPAPALGLAAAAAAGGAADGPAGSALPQTHDRLRHSLHSSSHAY